MLGGLGALPARAQAGKTLTIAWDSDIDSLERHRGGILNVASVAGVIPGPGSAVYYASKAFALSFSEALHYELKPRGVRVTCLCPGPVSTELFLNGKSPELIDRLARMNPMERLGTPEDIASAVAFLVGPDGGWINGQVVRANGGMV